MSRYKEVGNDHSVNSRVSRRSFLKGAFVSGAGLYLAYLGIRGLTDEIQKPGSLIGKEVEGDRGHLLEIYPFPSDSEVPVRSTAELGDDNLVGWAKVGHLVQARKHWGVTYNEGQGLGKKVGPDGELYGEWYKIQLMPVYDQEVNSASRRLVESVFIPGYLVRGVTEEQKHKFYTSSE